MSKVIGQLSLFHDRYPDAVTYKLSVSTTRVRKQATEHEPGDTVFWLVRATMGPCSYDPNADGELIMTETHKGVSAVELPDLHVGVKWLDEQHKAEREAAGIPNMDDALESFVGFDGSDEMAQA